MTETQYKRWRSFAVRMALHGFSRMRKSKARRLAAYVREWFDLFENNYLNNACVESRQSVLGRIHSWDHTTENLNAGNCHAWQRYEPTVGDEVYRVCNEILNPGSAYEEDAVYLRWDDDFGSNIKCCIRAGIDLASEPSMGVLGFTAGDLRRMYPKGVPRWVFDDQPLTVETFTGVVPGIGYKMGEPMVNGPFRKLPNSDKVWL